MTTNKNIYTLDEKAIIIGAIPEDAPAGYAVLIRVTGPEGDCATQNTLPAADNSFISRPVRLDECGVGEFTVSAFYADQKVSSTFTISNSSSHADAGSKLELRILKKVMLQAQDVVNTRVKELIESGYVLPEDVADKYSEGISEASLALQAIEFGDAAEAKKHMIFAVRDLREVLKALSEDVARFEQTEEQQTTSDSNSDVVGMYNILQRKYSEFQNIAEKNQIDKEDEFEAAELLLSGAKRMIEEGNYEGAEKRLEQVNVILEEIRADLYNEEEGEEKEEEKLASDANATSSEDEQQASKLTNAADKFEREALKLLNQTGANAEAQAKLQEALLLIADARVSIEAQDLESAKDILADANKIIEVVRDMIEDDDKTSNSGENSDSDNSGESSDSDDEEDPNSSGEDDNEEKGSNSGREDKDDQ